MPIPQQEFIVAPPTARVSVEPQPVHNAIHSLLLLARVEHLSGLGDWVVQTAAEMTQAEHERHRLVMIGFHYAVLPRQAWNAFPAYLVHLEAMEAEVLRDKLLGSYARISRRADAETGHTVVQDPGPFSADEILVSEEAFLAFLRARFDEKHVDEVLERKAYSYLLDPPALQDVIVTHLRYMWETYLVAEMARVDPLLRDAVEAFQQVDLAGMDRLQAAEFVTGQPLVESWICTKLEEAERLIFVPSAHVGPYLGTFRLGDALGIIFGARLPEGIQFHAPDLSRAEIVVRLNALADDTRLHILKVIAMEGELRSQDIMERLDLSQSAASRHLKQLSATGYLNERRCGGAKCYRLSPERVEDTLQAVAQFLKPSS